MLVSEAPEQQRGNWTEDEVHESHIVDLSAPRRRFGPVELFVIGLIVLTLGAVAAVVIGNSMSTNSDEAAKSTLRKAQAAMTQYKLNNRSFEGVSVDALRAIDSSLSAQLDPPIVSDDNYRLSFKTPDGITYNLSRSGSGIETRTCVAAPDGAAGDCAVQRFGVGTW